MLAVGYCPSGPYMDYQGKQLVSLTVPGGTAAGGVLTLRARGFGGTGSGLHMWVGHAGSCPDLLWVQDDDDGGGVVSSFACAGATTLWSDDGSYQLDLATNDHPDSATFPVLVSPSTSVFGGFDWSLEWEYVAPTPTPSASPAATRSSTASATLSTGASPSATPTPSPLTFVPSGLLTHVRMAALQGWSVCHTSGYDEYTVFADALAGCDAPLLMLGCRRTGSDELDAAAWGLYEDALARTEYAGTNEFNGALWWNAENGALGAAPAGVNFVRSGSGCPSAVAAGEVPVLCWPRSGGYLSGGGRCGTPAADGGYPYYGYERVLLRAAQANVEYVSSTGSPSSTPSTAASPSTTATTSRGASSSPTNAPAYAPRGPQTHVPLAALVGWRRCFTLSFGSSAQVSAITAACPGASLMMACRESSGASSLQLLAWASRQDVLFDPGNSFAASREANGVNFYYGSSSSWGFAAAGDAVSRSSCDTADTNAELRLCLHVSDAQVTSGHRCGSAAGISGGWERVFFDAGELAYAQASGSATATPSPSVSLSASGTPAGTPTVTSSLSPGAAASATAVPSQVYYAPYGPQRSVLVSSLAGWTQCHISTFAAYSPISDVFAACTGPSLMMACRYTGSTTLQVLAWAGREDVRRDVGNGYSANHVANGIAWYFSSR
jgi:hypothetical protein